MSSRNMQLNTDERAICHYRALSAATIAARPIGPLCNNSPIALLEQEGFKVDYVSIATADTRRW